MFFRAVSKSNSQFVICEARYRARYLTRAKKNNIRFKASPHTMFSNADIKFKYLNNSVLQEDDLNSCSIHT